MGNYLGLSKDDDSEDNDNYDVRRIYWDKDGNLRHGRTERNRDDEIVKILQADTHDETDMSKLWMIIPSRWIRNWLIFAHYRLGDQPGPIDMLSLLKQDPTAPGGWRPKKNLLPPSTAAGEERPGHYRRISLEAWVNLVDLYGVDGYALAVRGYPYDDLSRWRVFKDPKRIDINTLPEPVLPTPEEKKDEGVAGAIMGGMGKLLGGFGLGGGGSDKDKDKAKDKGTKAAAPAAK
eukprot:gene36122-43805_t